MLNMTKPRSKKIHFSNRLFQNKNETDSLRTTDSCHVLICEEPDGVWCITKFAGFNQVCLILIEFQMLNTFSVVKCMVFYGVQKHWMF